MLIHKFLLIILYFGISKSESITYQRCIDRKQCFINGPVPQCSGTSIPSSYDEIENLFKENYIKWGILNIDQIQCGTNYEQCTSINPEDIKKKCYDISLNNGQCCYMKLKFKYNSKFACYPIEKNKKVIKNKIKELKEMYVGIKKISIKCDNAYFDKVNFYFLVFFIFILI